MSNLLDKSSIVLTPTAYDNGKVLCVKPSDGSGDFDFSRNSAATRVNAQGLVEDVQILSSNLVQNGDFSEQGAEEVSNGSFSQQGSQLVTNGDFATDSDWTKEVGWTISGGTANYSGGSSNRNIRQAIGITNGKTYKIQYQVTAITSGEVACRFGGMSGVDEITATTTGTYVGYITANSSVNGELLFEDNDNNFVGSIDNCSVVEVGQNFTFGTGWGVAEDKAVCDGTQTSNSGLVQQGGINGATINFVVGKTYKVNFDVVVTSGVITMIEVANGVDLNSITASGNHTTYITAVSTNNRFTILANPSFIGSVTNISVKEVDPNNYWTVINGIITDKYNASMTAYQSGIRITPFTKVGTFKVVFDLVVTSGSMKFDAGGGNDQIYSTSGTKEIIATNTTKFEFNAFNLGWVGTLTNISVIEITNDTNLPRINYEGFSYQDVLGSEEIVNGDFATDSDWVKQTGWSIANGLASCDGSQSLPESVYQNGVTVVGKIYKITYTIVSRTSGSVRALAGTIGGTFQSTPNTYIEYLTATGNVSIGIQANADFVGSIDNVSVKEVLGQEVVPDSGCGSWLFEPQSTNLITYSEDFSNASWIKSSTTVVDDASTSPDGTINASSIEIASGGFMYFTHSATINIGDKWTWSCFVKSSDQKITWGGGTPDGTDVYSIETLSNGWYRHILQRTFTASGTNIQPMFSEAVAGTDLFYIYGSQLEALSYATSYIPTDGTQKTRNQDVCNNGGSVSTINSTEGVLYAEINFLEYSVSANNQISISDGSSGNRIMIYAFSNTQLGLRFNSSGSQLVTQTVTVSDLSIFSKIAVRWGGGNYTLYQNGLEIYTQAIASTPIGLDKLNFSSVTETLNFFGKTKCLAVWKEALSDENLAELTTI